MCTFQEHLLFLLLIQSWIYYPFLRRPLISSTKCFLHLEESIETFLIFGECRINIFTAMAFYAERLPNNVMSVSYYSGQAHWSLSFLQQEPALLEDVSFDVWLNMWFQHDGCPAHYSIRTLEIIGPQFPCSMNRESWPG